jgi:hypothetical protein
MVVGDIAPIRTTCTLHLVLASPPRVLHPIALRKLRSWQTDNRIRVSASVLHHLFSDGADALIFIPASDDYRSNLRYLANQINGLLYNLYLE